jgi:putative IMPACT (imprinted ancient) family translation regulator
VTDACCVVTRYFGGILLGTGGLARAYSRAAALALEAAGLSRVRLLRRLSLSCPYPLYERVRRELALRGAAAEREDFGAAVELSVLVEKDEAEALVSRLAEISSGAVAVESAGEEYGAVPIK